MKQSVFVVGGAALDIIGAPATVCRLRDSNIGRVTVTVGGVGHNIAKALTRYPLEVELVTALGDDAGACTLSDDCLAAGIGMRHAVRYAGASDTYLCILDEDGDMLAGINDMGGIARVTPARLAEMLPAMNAAGFCVLDANLSAEALGYLTENLTCPILYEPVSCAKAKRIGAGLSRVFAAKPNRFEAAALSGCSCDTLRGVYRAADWFLAQGVKRVFISMGGEGVYWADEGGCGLVEAEHIDVVNTTGAGDFMAAAIAWGILSGDSTENCARAGNHQSALRCAGKEELE